MVDKNNKSPLNQFGLAGRLGGRQNQPQAQNIFAGGLSADMRNLAAQNSAQQAQQAQQAPMKISGLSAPATPTVKKQMMHSEINPKAFGNARMIRNVYGSQNPGTFTRSVPPVNPPIMQMQNQDMQMDTSVMSQDMPQMPPQGVETSITPTLGFENN